MSLLKAFLALPAGATATVKDSKMCQILGLKIVVASILPDPLAINSASAAIKQFLKKLILTTQFSQTSTPMATNLNLFDAIVLSTDMAGIAKAKCTPILTAGVVTSYDNVEFFIPLIQGNGEIVLNWQADLFNNSATAIDVSFFSNSENMGDTYYEYNAFTLDNDLQVNIKTDFAKILVETNFSQINMTYNTDPNAPLSVKLTPEDAIIYDNLKDTAVIVTDVDFIIAGACDVVLSDVMMPSDTGKYILLNSGVSSFVLFRLDGAPAIPYATAKVKRIQA